MAKLEKNLTKSENKKSKGKKRKHASTEHDDEVANKSLIVDTEKSPEEEHEAAQENTAKNLKRKNKTKNQIKEKRAKQTVSKDLAEENEAIDDDQELHEPTLEELRACEKPENTKAILTVRQKKKQKHQERLDARKDQSGDKEKQRNAEYLQKWKHAREQWKFEKLRQISIQHTMFDEEKLDAQVWPIALEYLSGSKGAAKEKITKLAENVIDQLDTDCGKLEDEAERQAIVDAARYQRARELLQSFD